MISSKKKMIGEGMTFDRDTLQVTCLSVGNPHVVVHVKKDTNNWKAIGRMIEQDKRFPKRTNVEFVQVISPKVLGVFVWERGAGETGSSGTGAAASLAAMVVGGKSSRSVTINFPAGKMQASWPSDESEISTTALVEFVGVIEVAN
jgi:diaminopimelate epimerase